MPEIGVGFAGGAVLAAQARLGSSVSYIFCKSEENVMDRYITATLVLIAGAGIGAAAVQVLHAQVRSPAYNIAEITVTNDEGYNKEYVPPIVKSIQESGGKFIVRGGKAISVLGLPSAPRVVIIQFDSLDKAQAWVNSPAYKAAQSIGEKYATFRACQVEGISP
jgi:uncharacterized protein (DUF1330 family)